MKGNKPCTCLCTYGAQWCLCLFTQTSSKKHSIKVLSGCQGWCLPGTLNLCCGVIQALQLLKGFYAKRLQKNFMSFNAPLPAPKGMSTQKWDKMSGFGKASWRDLKRIPSPAKLHWVVLSEPSTSGTKAQTCLKGQADPWAAPVGAESSCNTGTENPLIGPCAPHPCLAQTAPPGTPHWFPLGQSLFSSQWLCFGFVSKTLPITLGCFHYCWAALTQSQGLLWLSPHPTSA